MSAPLHINNRLRLLKDGFAVVCDCCDDFCLYLTHGRAKAVSHHPKNGRFHKHPTVISYEDWLAVGEILRLQLEQARLRQKNDISQSLGDVVKSD